MPRLLTPGVAFSHFKRYRQIVGVLVKYGFGEFLGQLRLWEYVTIEKRLFRRPASEFAHMSHAQRLRLAMEELGPTFVKLGQMLSTRPDLVSPEFIAEFEKLQNRVAPISASAARQVIVFELGCSIEDLFTSFTDEPLAAASLAQVHRATMDGREVVVKVQRPHIEEIIAVDLDIMQSIAALLERYVSQAWIIDPVGLVREFSDGIKKELDFRVEANNMRRFAANFAGDPNVHVPQVYNGTYRRVLIMEYIQGINISEIERLKKEGYDLKLIAERGIDLGFKSTMVHGFFHADPHPGNIFVLPGNVICLLDYGMMGTLSARYRERLGRLLFYIVSNDEKRMARALLELMESQDVIDAEEIESEVSDIVHEYFSLPVREIRLGIMLFKMFRLLLTHRVRFHTHLVWLAKAVANIEETAHKLIPEIDMMQYARPYAQRLLNESISPVRQPREILYSILDAFELIKDFPYDAGVLLRQAKKGRFKIEFEHLGLEPIRSTIFRASRLLGLTLILGALLVASALLVVAKAPPLVWDFPLLAIIGFFFSILLAAYLLATMFLSR